MAMDKQTRELIRFIRDLQGSRRYKGIDKLSRQYRQAESIKAGLTK